MQTYFCTKKGMHIPKKNLYNFQFVPYIITSFYY